MCFVFVFFGGGNVSTGFEFRDQEGAEPVERPRDRGGDGARLGEEDLRVDGPGERANA